MGINEIDLDKDKNKGVGTKYNDSISGVHYENPNSSSPKGVSIDGKDGDDIIIGSSLDDKLIGGSGNDTIISGHGNDSITGGAGENVLMYDSSDSLYGINYVTLSKNEILNIQDSGFDSVSGGITQDSFNKKDLVIYGGSKDIVLKNAATKDAKATILINNVNPAEVAMQSTVSDWYFIDSETHKLTTNKYTGTFLADVVDATSVTESISKKGLTIDTGAGNDSVVGSQLNDKLIGGDGNDTLFGSYGNNSVYGGNDDDLLYASEGNDALYGGDGNDTLIGSSGNTSITGGAGNNIVKYDRVENIGNDTIIVSKDEKLQVTGLTGELKFIRDSKNKNDLVVLNEQGSVTIKNYVAKDVSQGVSIGSSRLDELVTLTAGDKYFNPSEGKANNKYTGTRLKDSIDAGRYKVDSRTMKGVTVDAGAGNDVIVGSIGNDKLVGGAGDDSIIGNGGNDLLYGGAGNDTFIGAQGNSSITGGSGENTITYDSNASGSDTIILSKDEKLFINRETTSFSIYQDTSNKNNLLIEMGSKFVTVKNCLNKDIGATISVNGVNLSETAMLDSVGSAYFYDPKTQKVNNKYTGTTLADVVDGSSIDGSISKNGLTIDGNAGNDSIIGSQLDDKLTGGAGNDTVFGAAGNDTILGGAGDDILYASEGNDALYGGDGDDTFIGSSGNTSIIGGAGNNVVKYDGVENIGNDTIVAAKGETISTTGLSGNVTFAQGEGTKGANNLIITNDKKGTITVNNFISATKLNFTGAQGSSDSYDIQTFDSNTALQITENGTENDKLTLGANANDIGVVFNVSKVEGNFVADDSNIVFVNKDTLSLDTLKAINSDDSTLKTKGVNVVDSASENTGIETLATKDHTDINKNSWYNAIAESVGSWLNINGFESTQEAMQALDAGATVDTIGLIDAYKNVNYSGLS